MADRLIVRGAREHNLKDVSLDLPRDSLIVFTGLSGSGKSSLAFDTIFAEGQRRYVESLSAYARQFLGQMDKPDVDFIEGLSPAVSIDQKSTSRNPRSTVGTITEVYDYLRLLFARAGQPHCPECGRPIARQTPQQIVDRVLELDEGAAFQVLAPVIRGRKGEYVDLFRQLQTQGFSRARVDGETHPLTEPPKLNKQKKHTIEVVVDRLAVKESAKRRLTDSVETALGLSGGLVMLDFVDLPEDDPQRERRVLRAPGLPVRRPVASRSSSRGRSRSTRRSAPAPTATASAPGWRSTPSWSSPTPQKSLDEGAIPPWSAAHVVRLLRPAARRARRGAGLLHRHALGAAAREGAGGRPPRAPEQGPRPLQEPLRPRALLLRPVRGRDPLRRAPARRGRDRHQPGAVRGLHARGARARPARAPGSSRSRSRSPSAARTSPRSARCRSARRRRSCATTST